jgi:ABC-type branched-subunit amino acid transport system substrate-binding protein
MTHNSLDLTKHYPALLEILTYDTGMLSSDDKLILTSHVAEMIRLAKEAKAAQHTTTAIYLHTLWEAETTLAAAATLKLLNNPSLSPEFEQWEQERRTQFLETLHKLANEANQKVINLASFSRFYYK